LRTEGCSFDHRSISKAQFWYIRCCLELSWYLHNFPIADPVIVELAQDIFRELSQNEACLGPLQHRLVPTLISILQSALDKVPSGLHAVALDVVETLVRASQPPLSDALMQTFPCVIQLAMTSDDATIAQVPIFTKFIV